MSPSVDDKVVPLKPRNVVLAGTTTTELQDTNGKKIARRSSKPIINWFQRKLAGKSPRTAPVAKLPVPRDVSSTATTGASRQTSQSVDSTVSRNAATQKSISGSESTWSTKRGTLVSGKRSKSPLNPNDAEENGSIPGSLSPPSSAEEADEDASLRPIAPSLPPSPSNSYSSSSILSDPRTFRSMAPSTKPTTLLSIDLAPNGMAHIAQVSPNVPTLNSEFAAPRFLAHVRNSSVGTSAGGMVSSGASITFSTLPPASPEPSNITENDTSASHVRSASGQLLTLQAPLHSAPHPRNNPRPSSPPLDNASVLTLASSAYAMPPSRTGPRRGWSSAAGSYRGGDESMLGGSAIGHGDDGASHYEDRLDVDGERDVDASVRALRPRSSRHNSWESEASEWSAVVGRGGPISVGTPTRSLWTSNSFRTGDDDEEQTDVEGNGEIRAILTTEEPSQILEEQVVNTSAETPTEELVKQMGYSFILHLTFISHYRQ